MAKEKVFGIFGKCVIGNKLYKICDGGSPVQNCKKCSFYFAGKCKLEEVDCVNPNTDKFLHFEIIENLTFWDKVLKFFLLPII